MKGKSLKGRLRPHLWYQAYWFVYLIWFFTLDALVQNPKYIIHSPLDDYILLMNGSFSPIAAGLFF